MFQRALIFAVWLLALSQVAASVFAEDESPGVANVIAPAPDDVAVPEPVADRAHENSVKSSVGNEASEPIHEPTPPNVTAEGETVLVSPPGDPNAVSGDQGENPEAASSGLTIRIGPETGDAWPKPLDFSDSRWWPSSDRMQWMPGHRDRFGTFSLVGENAYAWNKWEGLSSIHGYGYHFLEGPVSSDLPSKLFDFTWGLHWAGEVMPGWSASLSGRVGVFTDFEDSVRDGWRFPAHAIVFHDWTDTVRGVAGVQYLDRENLPALPVLGLILRPDDRVRVEAVFPEPRIAWRVHRDEESENWLSISGEIGGGEWAIERSNTDLADVVTYNDYSAVLGLHHYKPGKRERAFEIGYVFARDLEYRSSVGDFQPEETFFIRLSTHF